MEINPRFEYIDGGFDTKKVELLCFASDKHGTVELCVREPDSSWNIGIGEIKLYDSELYADFKATLNDARKLGNEICRRWNECENKE